MPKWAPNAQRVDVAVEQVAIEAERSLHVWRADDGKRVAEHDEGTEWPRRDWLVIVRRAIRAESRAGSSLALPLVSDGRRVRRVDVIDELVANNRDIAASLPTGHLDVRPSRRLAIVTCMDSRLNVFAALGLRDGEAHVLRNAGGVITDDVIRSLAVSQRQLGTQEVMLIHHTDCGMQTLTDDGFRDQLQRATGVAPAFAIESFTDLDADVSQSILRVRRSPFLLHRELIRGFVYDVHTHDLREIHVDAER